MPASSKKAAFALLLLSIVFISVLSSPATKAKSAEEAEAPKTNRETRTFGFRLFDVPREWSTFQQLLRFPQFPQFSSYPPRQEVNWFEDDSEALENLRRRVSDLEIGQRRIISYLRRLQAQLNSKPGSESSLPNVDAILPQPSPPHHSASTPNPSTISDRMDSDKPTSSPNSPPHDHKHQDVPSPKPSGIFTMTSTSVSDSQGPSTTHSINIDIHGPSKPTSPMSTTTSDDDHHKESGSPSTSGMLEDVSVETRGEVDLRGPGMSVPESTHKPMVQKDRDDTRVMDSMGETKSPMVEVKVNDEKVLGDDGEKEVRVGSKGWNVKSKKEGDDLMVEFNDIKRSL